MERKNIYSQTLSNLRSHLSEEGENPAKAEIIFDGIYRQGVSLAELKLSERVRKKLSNNFEEKLPIIVERRESDNTAKLLLNIDGDYIETVLMRQSYGAFVCVSTQVGCSMNCAFCRSGKLKRKRSLSSGEIVGQILTISREFKTNISGVSVMGIGEPFDNYEAVCEMCDIITAGKGLAIGERHITISTCGIVPKIYDYANLLHPCNLAISLHAPTDELRDKLMPINKKYSLKEVIAAAEYYSQKTNRRVALEYVMLSGVNDSPEHAQTLSNLIGSRNFYVNIIPYNDSGCGFSASSRERIAAFYDVLKKHSISVTMRREFGGDLDAACGQLSAKHS